LSKENWEGFQPIAYELDMVRLEIVSVMQLEETGESQRTNVRSILRRLHMDTSGESGDSMRSSKVEWRVRDYGTHLRVVADEKVIVLDKTGDSHFGCGLIKEIAELVNDRSVDLGGLEFYYYHQRWWLYEDVWEDGFQFFVVAGSRIVSDKFEITRFCDGAFDPAVFRPRRWCSDEALAPAEIEAVLRLRYEDFYNTTQCGALVSIDPTATIFHDADSPRSKRARRRAIAELPARLARMEGLAMVACLLLLILVFRSCG
jgi:hypothetical protein